MSTMILDLGTTVAILAAALAIIPLPDVFIGWFCMLFPAMRSPATRMGDLHSSLESTRGLLSRNWPNWAGEAPDSPAWRLTWEEIEKEANALEVLVKGGGWGRYSVAHLLFCTRAVRRLDGKFTRVTKKLVTFNKNVFTARAAVLEPQQSNASPDEDALEAQEHAEPRSNSNEKGARHPTTGMIWHLMQGFIALGRAIRSTPRHRAIPDAHHHHGAGRRPSPRQRLPSNASDDSEMRVPTEDPEHGSRPRVGYGNIIHRTLLGADADAQPFGHAANFGVSRDTFGTLETMEEV